MPLMRHVALAGIVSAVAAGALAAGRRAPADSLASFRFMAGCWQGATPGGGAIEEYYTAPSANVMLGVTRYLKGDRVVEFEFTSIVREDSAIIVTPRPEGQRPAPFRVTRLAGDSAVWENPQHDFPRLVAYRRIPGDSLVARIEGPGKQGTRSMEWRMGRVRCEPA
jgi:hypothetical protein